MSTEICNSIVNLGPGYEATKATSVCFVYEQITDDQNIAWLLYISQIGFTNGHALLALFTIIYTVASYIYTTSGYSLLTGILAFTKLSEFQKLHLLFHWVLTLFSC
ncbi:hypothetical protein HK096_008093, partial [Nowakowskiella sp. JEL0078]